MGLFSFFNSKKKKIEDNLFNSALYQEDLLERALQYYLQNRHDYALTRKMLIKEGLSDEQSELIIDKLKAQNKLAVDNLQRDMDSGKIASIKISPNPDHTHANTNKEQVDRYIAYGAFQLDRGDFENALELLDKALELDPRASLAYANKGTLYSRMGDKEKALTFYQKALEIDPQNASIYTNIAVALEELGRNDEATAAYKKATRFNHMEVQALNNLGVNFAQKGKLTEALDCFEQVLKVDPDDTESQINKLKTLVELNQADNAYSFYRACIRNNKTENVQLHYILPTDLYIKGDKSGANNFFDKFHQETGKSEYLLYKGHFYFERDLQRSWDSYTAYLKVRPADPIVLEYMLHLTVRKPDVTEAEIMTAVDSLLTHDENNMYGLFYKTQYYNNYGMVDDAMATVEKMYAAHPLSEQAADMIIDLYRIHNTKEEVFALFERLKRENPNEAYNLNYKKGLYLMNKVEYTEAIAIFEHQNRTEEFAWNYYQIAICHLLMGNTDDCLKYLRKTLALDPSLKEDMRNYPHFQTLRTNIEFIQLVK